MISKNNPFSKKQLLEWQDQIDKWIEAEKDKLGAEKTVKRIQAFLKVSKSEALNLGQQCTLDPTNLNRDLLDWAVKSFKSKLKNSPILWMAKVRLSCEVGAQCLTEFKGERRYFDVPGHIAIVGEVHYSNGEVQSVFQRFMSHPFWQCSHLTHNIFDD